TGGPTCGAGFTPASGTGRPAMASLPPPLAGINPAPQLPGCAPPSAGKQKRIRPAAAEAFAFQFRVQRQAGQVIGEHVQLAVAALVEHLQVAVAVATALRLDGGVLALQRVVVQLAGLLAVAALDAHQVPAAF